jgi:hypothetical protein
MKNKLFAFCLLLSLGGYGMLARENMLVQGIKLPELKLARPDLQV